MTESLSTARVGRRTRRRSEQSVPLHVPPGFLSRFLQKQITNGVTAGANQG